MRTSSLLPLLFVACLAGVGSRVVLATQATRPAQDEKPPPPIDFTEADRFFAIADYNGNGWVAYGEAHVAFGIDQVRFFAFDTSRDGRIELEEFRKVYADAIKKVGAFPPPLPDPTRPAGLDAESPADVADPALPVPSVTTIEELFGRIEERDDGPEAQPRPPRLVGPVPMFRRLDFDDDGLISVQDLSDLGRPLAHPVRVRALVADLDLDQDGAISRAEFRRSMQSKLTAPTSR